MKNEVEKIDPKDYEKRIKKEQFKRRIKEKIDNGFRWVNDNKELLIVIIPAAVAITKGGFKVAKSISRNIALSQEKKMKDRFIYDRSLGRYVELRRPLKNRDMQIILERKDRGEKLSTILLDLDLIK